MSGSSYTFNANGIGFFGLKLNFSGADLDEDFAVCSVLNTGTPTAEKVDIVLQEGGSILLRVGG